jgi:type I restriction enzyme R subunit
MVERVVNDVDQVVRSVRFEGWQNTSEGDRLVQQALRKTLYVKYRIRDNDIYERALGYIREYY